MVRIVLLNPPSEEGYIRSGRWTRKSRAHQQWYPIWLAYCTALLEREGHDCLLLDASAEGLNEWQTTDVIKNFKPDYVVCYWSYDTHKSDLAYIDFLGEKWNVILVGPWSYCLPDALKLTPHVKALTYGEFEHTVLELLKEDVFDVKGIYWRNHITGEIVKNPPRKLCSSEELDKIPFVTDVYKRHLNLKLYRQTSLKYPFVDLFTARGCPHRCVYAQTLIKLSRGKSKIIDNIRVGEYVSTLRGEGIVTEKRSYNENTVLVELDNGVKISVTPDHRFKTKRGWIQAKNLTKYDEVLTDG